jgi:hypothetical protein
MAFPVFFDTCAIYGAAIVVTFNRRHFPHAALEPYQLSAVHPDDFLLDQFDLYPAAATGCQTGPPPHSSLGKE